MRLSLRRFFGILFPFALGKLSVRARWETCGVGHCRRHGNTSGVTSSRCKRIVQEHTPVLGIRAAPPPLSLHRQFESQLTERDLPRDVVGAQPESAGPSTRDCSLPGAVRDNNRKRFTLCGCSAGHLLLKGPPPNAWSIFAPQSSCSLHQSGSEHSMKSIQLAGFYNRCALSRQISSLSLRVSFSFPVLSAVPTKLCKNPE